MSEPFKELVQNGHGVKHAARRAGEFLCLGNGLDCIVKGAYASGPVSGLYTDAVGVRIPCRRPVLSGFSKRYWRTAGLALILSQPFLVSAQNVPITPLGASPQRETEKPAQITPPAGAAAPVDSSTYKVGAGDILNIDVWHEPQFTGVYTVHSDGKITLKLVGELDAGEKTPNAIQDVVKAALSKYVLNPIVTVTVQEVISKKYYLDGLANRPGEYALVTPTTVFEAISRAGGLQEFANTRKIYVLRGDKRIFFNYKEVIHGKRMEQNIKLEPGDHIVIP